MDTTIGSTFAGVRLQQTWEALFCFEKALSDYRPDAIIELGTGYGALSIFFSLHAKCFTFDDKDKVQKTSMNVEYMVLNIFQHRAFNEVCGLLNNFNRVVLFCDNGDKKREFRMFAPHIRKGQVIGVHDWGSEINIWDIGDVIEGCELVPWKPALWEGYESLCRFWTLGG